MQWASSGENDDSWKFGLFKSQSRIFVVALFIEKDELEKSMREIEALGNQKNVTLTVQPCPFEGIEFLYRVSKDLIGHFLSLEKDVFWEALELKQKVSEKVKGEIASSHLDYLVSILEQNPEGVKKGIIRLKGYEEHFARPLGGG